MSSPTTIPLKQNPVYLRLKTSFQQTKTHLQITDLDFGHLFIEEIPHIVPNFLRKAAKTHRSIPPKLKRLTLDINFDRSDPQILYNHFLKDLKHLEYLRVPLHPTYANHPYSFFELLMKTLRKSRNLQVLEVIVPKNFDWTDKIYMQTLLKTLSKSAPRLRDLKLLFQAGLDRYVDAFNYKPLLHEWGIRRLAIVQNLTLHLPMTAFLILNPQSEWEFSLSALSKFRKLKTLDLAVVESGMYRVHDCERFVFRPPKGLFPNLKRFQWSLSHSRWTETEELHLLGAELARSLRIPPENFTLKYKELKPIRREGIKDFNQAFESLAADMKQVHLCFIDLDGKASESLMSFLSAPKMKKVEILDLMFLDCVDINDGFMMKFGKIISPELKYLRLRFDFIDYQKGFRGGTFMKATGEEEISDTEVSRFGESLEAKCKNLKFLWIEFGRYDKVTDVGVKHLCESLSKIESLERIWLKFRLCKEVSGTYAKEILGEKKDARFTIMK